MANLQCGNHRTRKNFDIKPLHIARLRTLEFQLEEYVLAFIKHPHLPRFLASLLFCWVSDCFSWIVGHKFQKSEVRKIQRTPSVQATSESMHRSIRLSGPTVCFIFALNTLMHLAKPLEWFGDRLELWLNVIHANNGLMQTLFRHLFNRDALRWPSQGEAEYFSIIGLLDSRQDLRIQRDGRNEILSLDSDDSIRLTADLCMMASKLAYENEKVVERVVNQQWKMNFVKFFDCWNEYLESNTTQAYIFTDKAHDADTLVLAFRGTQPFNMYDWCTDFDFSYYVLPEMGRVHVGFLEALGLGNRLKTETLRHVTQNSAMKASGRTPSSNPSSGLAKSVQDDEKKVLAYDAICSEIRLLMAQNPGAKLYITGHSLGGALAALFTGLLQYEWDREILDGLGGVFTFGQPRVGDATFASYMEEQLCSPHNRKYFRVVFRNDVVTRVPCDDNLLKFKHFGSCHYYSSISQGKVLQEEPHKNLYSLVFMPIFHWLAIQELYESLFKIFFQKKTNGDHVESGLCLLMRFGALLTPGTCAHSPTHYVNAIRSARAPFLPQEECLD